jgi:ribosomal-protein-alanine N-acetyltransferase
VRCWLRPFAEADLDGLHALFTDPSVRRYLLDDELVPMRWTRAEIERSRRSFCAHGHGLWSVALAEDGPPVGFTGYREFREPPVLELIYGLHPEHQGRGLAAEAARAAIRHGFETLGLDPIRASTDAPNEASLRLARRLGFREVRRSPGPAHEQVHLELPRTDERDGSIR